MTSMENQAATGVALSKKSAGLLLYRQTDGRLEVMLVHPGGPLWAGKDDGVWSIPKGEFQYPEEPLEAAKREFKEETGMAPSGEFIALEPVRQLSGKVVFAWAVRGDFDPARLKSNTFSMEWPMHSGRRQEFPEVDRALWLPLDVAMHKILSGQIPLLIQLREKLGRADALPAR